LERSLRRNRAAQPHINLTDFGAGERRVLGVLSLGLQWSQVKPGGRLCNRWAINDAGFFDIA